MTWGIKIFGFLSLERQEKMAESSKVVAPYRIVVRSTVAVTSTVVVPCNIETPSKTATPSKMETPCKVVASGFLQLGVTSSPPPLGDGRARAVSHENRFPYFPGFSRTPVSPPSHRDAICFNSSLASCNGPGVQTGGKGYLLRLNAIIGRDSGGQDLWKGMASGTSWENHLFSGKRDF